MAGPSSEEQRIFISEENKEKSVLLSTCCFLMSVWSSLFIQKVSSVFLINSEYLRLIQICADLDQNASRTKVQRVEI
jgi:hypothetical protein